MNYEKKYKEALERARAINSGKDVDAKAGTTTCEYIFPELKGSEDERIRKWCISHFMECFRVIKDNVEYQEYLSNKVIPWLEKQGESDETKAKIFLMNKGYPIDANGIFPTYEEMYNIIKDGLEMQSEQKPQGKTALEAIKEEKVDNQNCVKPTGKVGPRFKVGDWIVRGNTIAQILDIQEQYYVGLDINGKDFTSSRFLNCDKIHLWTIQDAKDGDVLVVPQVKGSEHTEQIFIFKEIKDRNYVKNAVEYYCRVVDNEFCVNERGFMGQSDDYFVPATKEQRDLLFQKMKEDGYEWDAEKKELKKSPNTLEECKIVHVEHGKYYYCIKDYYAGGNKRASKGDVVQALNGMSMMALGVKANEYFLPVNFIKYNPSWSKEDERIYQSIIDDTVQENQLDEKQIKWIKSLKQRIQPKVELTRLDEMILEAAIAFVEQNNHFNVWGGVDKHTVLSALYSLQPKLESSPS